MDSAEWAAIGLLTAVGIMLALIVIALRSRAHRPPPTPIAPASWSRSPAPSAGPTSRGSTEWSDK